MRLTTLSQPITSMKNIISQFDNPFNGIALDETSSQCLIDNSKNYLNRIGDKYIDKVFLNCASYFTEENPILSKDVEMVILTDGTCGSSCSQFISKLASKGKAYLVGIGGVPSLPYETSSFAGGSFLFFFFFLINYFSLF